MFQRLSSSWQSSINLSASESLAFLLAILITSELIWFTQISVFLPRFSFHAEYEVIEQVNYKLQLLFPYTSWKKLF